MPFVGVIFLGWSVFNIVFAYWLETAVIGFYAVLMLVSARNPAGERAGITLFFLVHFDLFLYAQLVIMLALFDPAAGGDITPFKPLVVLRQAGAALNPGLLLSVALMFASHGAFFAAHYVRGGAYRTADARRIMLAPYPRVFVQQAVVIFGGFFIGLLPVLFPRFPTLPALVVLLIMKVFVSALSHRREAVALRLGGRPRGGRADTWLRRE
jgi:hypothetical protein